MTKPDLQETIEVLEEKAHILSEPERAEFFYPTLANYLLIETANAINNAITLLKAQQEEIENFEAALIKIEQMLESYTAYNYPETIDEALRIARTALVAFAEMTGKIPAPPPETDNE
jgi:hypothetical protein